MRTQQMLCYQIVVVTSDGYRFPAAIAIKKALVPPKVLKRPFLHCYYPKGIINWGYTKGHSLASHHPPQLYPLTQKKYLDLEPIL